MEEENSGAQCLRCPFCTYDDSEIEDFQKVAELKNLGLVIYRHITRDIIDNEDSNEAKYMLQGITKTDLRKDRIGALPRMADDKIFDDVPNTNCAIILQNVKDVEIISADFMTEFEKCKASCPRCQYLMNNTQLLLESVALVDKNDVKGVCDSCRIYKKSGCPCSFCENLVNKFKTSKNKDLKYFQLLGKASVVEVKHDFMERRAYSEINIKKFIQKSEIFTERVPVVNPLFDESEFKRPKTAPLSDSAKEFMSEPTIQRVISQKVILQISKAHIIPEKVLSDFISQIELHDGQIEKNKQSVDTIRAVIQADQMKRIKEEPMKSGILIPSGILIHRGVTKPTYESAVPLRKFHSDESLISSFSGLNLEVMKKHFQYFFPRIKKKEIVKMKSSSEIIKDTQERFIAAAEEKKKLQEEIIKKEIEIEERIKKAREEKMKLAEEEEKRKAYEAKKHEEELERNKKNPESYVIFDDETKHERFESMRKDDSLYAEKKEDKAGKQKVKEKQLDRIVKKKEARVEKPVKEKEIDKSQKKEPELEKQTRSKQEKGKDQEIVARSKDEDKKKQAVAPPKDKQEKDLAVAPPKDGDKKEKAVAPPKDKQEKDLAVAPPKDRGKKEQAVAPPKDGDKKGKAVAPPKDKQEKDLAVAPPKDRGKKEQAVAPPKDGDKKEKAVAPPKDKQEKDLAVAPPKDRGKKEQAVAPPKDGDKKEKAVAPPKDKQEKDLAVAPPKDRGKKEQAVAPPKDGDKKEKAVAPPKDKQEKDLAVAPPKDRGKKEQAVAPPKDRDKKEQAVAPPKDGDKKEQVVAPPKDRDKKEQAVARPKDGDKKKQEQQIEIKPIVEKSKKQDTKDKEKKVGKDAGDVAEDTKSIKSDKPEKEKKAIEDKKSKVDISKKDTESIPSSDGKKQTKKGGIDGENAISKALEQKEKEERSDLERKKKEEELTKKNKELMDMRIKNLDLPPITKKPIEKPEIKKKIISFEQQAVETATTKKPAVVDMNKVQIQRSGDDLILQMIKLKREGRGETKPIPIPLLPPVPEKFVDRTRKKKPEVSISPSDEPDKESLTREFNKESLKTATTKKPAVVDMNKVQIQRSGDDLILQLIKMKRESRVETKPIPIPLLPSVPEKFVDRIRKRKAQVLISTSDLELDKESLLRKKMHPQKQTKEIIIGEKIIKRNRSIRFTPCKESKPALFKTALTPVEDEKDIVEIILEPELAAKPDEIPKGVIRYTLSDHKFIEKGWTILPTEKVVRKMNVYRMRPAHPEFDWFAHNKHKGLMQYDTGEKLAQFDDNGRGRWYYKNGRVALDYYDSEETNSQQRFVIYSSGEPDERGRSRPVTVLAMFDYLGNGVVFDHSGKIRLKYNQTEGVLLDREIGPVSHWKWHSLNDPPVLQQVMIDTHMPYKDPEILKLGKSEPYDSKQKRIVDVDMLTIEFNNFVKEKQNKLKSQTFQPFQIKMKALKINEQFSLRVMNQASVYLHFGNGSTRLKLNLGMILDQQEIMDTETADLGEVSNTLERLPAETDSLQELQRNLETTRRSERVRTERNRRLRPTKLNTSVDQLTAALSRPLRVDTVVCGCADQQAACCTDQYKGRKPPENTLYYDTRII